MRETQAHMNRKRSLLAVAAALLISHVSAPPAMAQSQGSTAILGAWTIDVHLENAPPGVTDFRSFTTYSPGGAVVEANGAPGVGPATGAWEFVRAREFAATLLKPTYDQTGAFQGTVKIRGRIQMKSEDEYESRDKIDFFLPDGTLAASWTSVVTAKRIKVEPVD